MIAKLFKFTSPAIAQADSAYDMAEEELTTWLEGHEGIKITQITQSSHIRHDTDGVELVDVIYTVFYV